MIRPPHLACKSPSLASSLAVLLMLFVLVVGPTGFLLKALVQNFGLYLDHFFVRTFNLYVVVFKPPSNWKADTLERRMATNLMHYRANYACVLLGALGLAIVLSPATIFALLVSAALCAYLFGFCKTPALVIGELKLPLTRRNKAALAGGGSVVVLGLSGALVWMLWMLSLGVAAVLSHMLFRPRSVKSRYNAVKEDLRLRDVLFAPFEDAAAW